jgi:hypothetical protein
MKTNLLTPIIITSFAALTTVTGCAYRDAKMWQDDSAKVLASKNNDIKACYDNILKGSPTVAGKVTVNFEVETEGGKIQNVVVDKANSNAPPELGDCVKKNIEGLVIAPPDSKTGQGTYVYEFSIPATPKS